MDLYELTLEKDRAYPVCHYENGRNISWNFLRKNGDWLINLDRNSLILDEEVYKRCLNLNTLNETKFKGL